MSSLGWAWLVSLGACMVLAVSAFGAHRVGARKTIVMALAWIAIFGVVSVLFTAVL